MFVIQAASKHKQAAWEFLDWICSPKAVKEFCLSVGNLPPLTAVAAEPEFQRDPLLKFATVLRPDRARGVRCRSRSGHSISRRSHVWKIMRARQA